ncbi:MAG: abortive phage infection protein [Pseudobutyrivibrio sp.]|nr:abortive phage infection protein [Pseudobutyrivibrio sp.]
MTKFEKLDVLTEKNNGYLFTKDVEKEGISRTYLAKYVKNKNLEKVARGIYIREDIWPDELFILQQNYKRIVFSLETALYLHGLLDREYATIYVTLPANANQVGLREKGIIVKQLKKEFYLLGQTEVKTYFGNTVVIYDKERCICDLIKEKEKIEVQTFQTAMKSYMRSSDKDLTKLLSYASKLNMKEEVMKYIEVMI